MKNNKKWYDEDNFIVNIYQLYNLFSKESIFYRVLSPFVLWRKERILIPKGSVLEISSDGSKTIITSVCNHITKYDTDGRILDSNPEIFKKL